MTLICALDHCHSSHQEQVLPTAAAHLYSQPAGDCACSAAQRIGAGLRHQGHDLRRAPASSKGMPHGPGGSGGDRLAVVVPSVIITADVAVVLADVTVIVLEIAFLSVDLGALALCGPVIADRVVPPQLGVIVIDAGAVTTDVAPIRPSVGIVMAQISASRVPAPIVAILGHRG